MPGSTIHRAIARLAQSAAAAAGIGALTPLGLAQCYYEVTVLNTIDCGIFGEGSITPLAIASNGWITGTYPQCDFDAGSWVALRESGTAVTALIPPFAGVTNAEGRGISSTGLIVGTMDISGVGQRGFLHDHGTGEWAQIDPMGTGGHSGARTISDNGLFIGGYRDIDGIRRGTVLDDGTFIEIAPTYGTRSIISGVNNNGDATEEMGPSLGLDSHLLLFTGGIVSDVGAMEGAIATIGRGINSCKTITGDAIYFEPPASFATLAFIWSAGVYTTIPPLPGFMSSFGNGIDSDDKVVGFAKGTAKSINERKAFIWENGVMTPLDGLVDPALGLEILEAYSINDSGIIACIGIGPGIEAVSAIILTPPSPTDLTGDCITDIADLLVLLAVWGSAGSPADFDDSGQVDVVDLLFLLGHWS